MKIGNTSFNPEAIKAMTFEEFYETFKGKLHIPAEDAYKQITGADMDDKSDKEVKSRVIKAKVKKQK